MDRRQNKPAFITANEKVLEAEAAKIEAAPPLSQPGNIAATPPPPPTTTTTTKAPETRESIGEQTPAPSSRTTTDVQSGPSSTTTTQVPAGQSIAAPAGISDEQILAKLRATTGFEDLTMEQMVAAIQRPETLSEDDKKKKQAQDDLALQAAFINAGKGTIDDFHIIRQLKNIPDEPLVREHFREAVKEQSPELSDEEIEDAFKRHYFIGEEGEYNAHEIKIGQKRLAETAKSIRDIKSAPLNEVEQAVQMDAQALQGAKEWKAKVKQFTGTMPKTLDIPLGLHGTVDLGNFSYILTEAENKELSQALEDPAYLLRQIADEKTGKTDLNKLFGLIRDQKILKTAIIAAARAHYDKGVDSIASVLHNYPNLNGQAGGSKMQEQNEKVAEGQQIAKRDAANVFGRRNKVKSI